MNCWEVKRCGRIPGGNKVSELGVCPAYTEKAGDSCWLVKGTLCQGKVQNDVRRKKVDICYHCNFFESLSFDHRFKMDMEYHDRLENSV